MSLRPRFAGDGRLRLPGSLFVMRSHGADQRPGDVFWLVSAGEVDPFERDAEGLLLAEAFARFDLSRPRKARAWYLAHGAVSLASLFPDDVEHPDHLIDGEPQSHDTLAEILAQQRLVRWHLESLARLTEHRERAQPPRPGWAPHEGWDPRWSMAVLEGPDGAALWVGAPSDAAARPPAASDGREASGWAPRLPRLWVPKAGWSEYWEGYEIDRLDPHGRARYERLSSDWHGLMELQRRLIEPYVKRAAAFEVEVDREGGLPVWDETDRRLLGPVEQELVIREKRSWRSILAPIHLQLLEALRRVSEGKPGAAWCRECGQPFLTLDARRSTFCTDRERSRHSQRGRRQRAVRRGDVP